MDNGQFSQDEEMDEDAVDTDEDVEMEFGDETGSEDTSNTDEEDDEDDEGMEDGEQTTSEDGWDEQGVEDEDEEALVENEEDQDEEGDGASLADEDEGEEMVDDEDDEPEGELNWEVCIGCQLHVHLSNRVFRMVKTRWKVWKPSETNSTTKRIPVVRSIHQPIRF